MLGCCLTCSVRAAQRAQQVALQQRKLVPRQRSLPAGRQHRGRRARRPAPAPLSARTTRFVNEEQFAFHKLIAACASAVRVTASVRRPVTD